MTNIDSSKKKQAHQNYERRSARLDLKDNQFTSRKFYHIRKDSKPKKILHSFGRIAMRLNDKKSAIIRTDDLDNVCFILINNYKKRPNSHGVGPLNDGYLIALNQHRLGFKIFYLYNPRRDEFSYFLGFFMKNTKVDLTVFYSGLNSIDNKSIEFCNGPLSKSVVGDVISQNCNKKARVLFLTDCCDGGSVFDIHKINPKNFTQPAKLISFFVNKSHSPDSKESKRSHGLFTYYFCKIIKDSPNISTYKLVEKMNPSLKRFSESFGCDVTEKELIDDPLFSTN